MTTAMHLNRKPTLPYSHRIELSLDWDPVAAAWRVRGTESATGKASRTWFSLDTDGIIAEEEERECLAILDTRAHLVLVRLLTMQLGLF